jgi:hypothetical protein
MPYGQKAVHCLDEELDRQEKPKSLRLATTSGLLAHAIPMLF